MNYVILLESCIARIFNAAFIVVSNSLHELAMSETLGVFMKLGDELEMLIL
jgi:hypothetical protein